MAVSLFIVEKGYLDDVPLKEVGSFEQAVIDFMHQKHMGLLDKINVKGDFNDEIETALHEAIGDFKSHGVWA